MQLNYPTLYEQDFYLWLETTANLLKDDNWEQLDFENLAEEIQSLSHIEQGIVRENCVIILIHLLKWKYQPETWSNSWRVMIDQSRNRIYQCFLRSPSLQEYLCKKLNKVYSHARKMVATETGVSLNTFPEINPFSMDEILDRTFMPDGFFPQYYE
ncbi:DUF29 domain-containing protein [Synechocystis salina]|uniref:DUF29 domain-containing protein n=1 Tax=Synechocystis salina TaxID=945780 RepID=UPI001D15E400|nr:DUF29 domain-containing protein [Synechocystis salina]